MPRRVLRSYQRKMLRYTIGRDHIAFFVHMRLGKTLVTIRWVRTLTFRFDPPRILIVAPYSAFESWREELKNEGEPKLIELVGTWDQRHATMMQGGKWYIINKEGFLTLPHIADRSWDVVILDESTFIKNPRSQASKFFTRNFRNTPHRAILTGTPDPESDLDYIPQLNFLDENILGKSYWEYRHAWFIHAGHDHIISQKGQAHLSQRLAQNCFFLTREQAGLKDERIYTIRGVQFKEESWKIYTKLKEEFLLIYKDQEIETGMWSTQQFLWMRRLTGGFVGKFMVDPSKFNELQYLVKELNAEQIVVWCSFHQESDYIIKNLKTTCISIDGRVPNDQRLKRLHDFRKGRYQVLIGHPDSLKYGVDLSNANTEIYYSTPLGLESRQQSEERIVKIGKVGGVYIIDLCVERTVDEDIIMSLRAKESRGQMMRRLVEHLKVSKGR